MKLILLMMFIVSCSSTMVKTPGPVSKYAPKDHKERGVVEYLNAGADWMVQERKEDAYRKMYEACKGDYTILREGNKAQFNAVFEGEQNMWVIEFSCNSVATK